ncbi:MAG: hypothetical protein VX745_10775 [Pseudomonadota bacterium]|nr:hypothetical protein [Pseudomonadota bacterium]
MTEHDDPSGAGPKDEKTFSTNTYDNKTGRGHRALAQFALAILARVPSKVLPALAMAATAMIVMCARRTIHTASCNIRLCWPTLTDRQQRRILLASTYHIALTALQSPGIWRNKGRYILTEVEGIDLIDQCQREGQGAILVMPHLGNWEVLNHFLGSRFRLTHMFRPNNRSAINQLVQQQRAGTGTRFVPADAAGVRTQLKHLNEGGVIGLMPDQEPDVHVGEFAPFFGVPALTSSLPIRLAERSNAQIFLVSCTRHARRFHIRCTPLGSESIGLSVTRLNEAITRLVREHPDQYLWSYKRFRTRPAGEAPLYPHLRTPFLQTRRALSAITGLAIRHTSRRLRGKLASLFGRVRTMARDGSIARTNLAYCGPSVGIENVSRTTLLSLSHNSMNRLLNAEIWSNSDAEIEPLFQCIEGREHFRPDHRGTGFIVLLPRLGTPDLVLRDLSIHYRVNEVLEPHSRRLAADQKIRDRVAHGIRCFDSSNRSKARLLKGLTAGEVVVFTPDMQPRLRDGLFLNFFGIPALTPSALPDLIVQSQARTLIGVALATGNNYELHYLDCQIDASAPDIGERIMRQLETAIRLNPEQYEWSYKRFNTRPAGQPKLYRNLLLPERFGRYSREALTGK